jgi:chorismate mutase
MSKLKLNIVPIREWLPSQENLVIISGPCSAESEKQMLSTALALAKTGKVNALRAGIWKPRTRPNSFEGMGEPALKWLKDAGRATGLPVATEVANAQHVELCLKNGIDILWVGARTTVNPFSVQEIADALKGVDIPVMVKNPVNPDLQLWIGALERINQAGITKIAAIHRGFSSFEKTAFRNAPKWEIAIELKTLCPELPIICDPSHISGNRELLPFVSQKALDLAMEGLMVESHIHPQSALSDAAQQVTPENLSVMLGGLVVRESISKNKEFKNQLEELRKMIDEFDEEIVQKFASRMQIAEKIGEYKRDNNVTILQVKRWEEVTGKWVSLASALGLSDDFTRKLLQLIHKESIRMQTAVMNRELAG